MQCAGPRCRRRVVAESGGGILGRSLGGAGARAGVEDAVAAADPTVAVLEVARADRQELAGQRERGEDAAADAGVAADDRGGVVDDTVELVDLVDTPDDGLDGRLGQLDGRAERPVGSMCWTGLLPA
jgi:hypothetical protein